MPGQEEVDEINEFLQKRREKQRLGELPRNDFTPNFAKKISLAVFGKPRAEKVPLQSTQPTVASTQAQAAMRQQLDEIMDSHLSNTARAPPAAPLKSSYFSSPAPAKVAPMAPTSPTRGPVSNPPASAAPSAPRVPHYYSNMPYPPYIQRGLASLPKSSPTAAQAAALPRAAAPPSTSNSPVVPRTTAWPTPAGRVSSAAPIAPTAKPTAQLSSTATNPAPTPSAAYSAPRITPILPPGERKIPAAQMAAPSPPATPRPAVPSATASPSASVSLPPKQSFWKKLFGGKQAPASSAEPALLPAEAPTVVKPIAPSPYATAARAPIGPIAPVSRAVNPIPLPSEKFSDISPVSTKQTAPSVAREDISTIAREKTILPALSPPTPAIIPEKKIDAKASAPATGVRESIETKKEFVPTTKPAQQIPAKPLASIAPEKILSPARAPSPNPLAAESPSPATASATKSPPYVPPWVARAAVPAQSPSSAVRETMPWKQPFGTHSDGVSSDSSEKNISLIKNDDLPSVREKKSPTREDDELKVEGADAYSAPIAPAQTSGLESAMEQEISEEEALESLPFEDVEGLSASDLDYLSQKEKEHRKAQDEKDNDLGVPSELKNTLQRQSTQLEGALTATPTTPKNPTSDEKQEILRRLKQMMEEAGHPQ